MITRQVPWSIHVLVTMKLYPRNCIRYNSVRHGKRNGSVVITVSIKGLGPHSLMTGTMMYHCTNLGNLHECDPKVLVWSQCQKWAARMDAICHLREEGPYSEIQISWTFDLIYRMQSHDLNRLSSLTNLKSQTSITSFGLSNCDSNSLRIVRSCGEKAGQDNST